MAQLPTGRGLFIAEKSSAMEDFKAVYEKIKGSLPYTLDFEKFHGHVTRQAPPEFYNPEWANRSNTDHLPMIPPKWVYVPGEDIERKTGKVVGPVDKLYTRVSEAIKRGGYDFLVCGTDPEREGNLIFDSFIETLEPRYQALKRYRFWNRGTTDVEVEKAFHSLLGYTDVISGTMTVQNLSSAAKLRAQLDWLVGLNATQVLTAKAGFSLRGGRVRTPIERLIVQRELEIRNFKPEQFFTLRASFSQNGSVYQGVLTDPETNAPVRFKTKQEADQLLASLSGKPATIQKVEKNKKSERPAAGDEKGSLGFFSTASLQGAAARVFGLSASESLAAIESLYEKKIITYARTDSAVITTEDAKGLLGLFSTITQVPGLESVPVSGEEELSKVLKNKRYVNDKEVRGHSALQPLPVRYDYYRLSDAEQSILYLVSRSILFPFLPDRVTEKTRVETVVDGNLFKTTGSVLLEPGWTSYVPEYKTRESSLPNLIQGAADYTAGETREGWTTPPDRYTVESFNDILINVHRLATYDEDKLALKKAEGIGRPSTRTAIITSLIEMDSLTVSGKKQEYAATDFAIESSMNLKDSDLLSPLLTARWETKLQAVEDGKLNPDQVYQEIVAYTRQMVAYLLKLDIEFSKIPAYAEKGSIGILEKTGTKVFKNSDGSAYYDEEFQSWMKDKDEADKDGLPVPPMRGLYLRTTLDNDSFKMKGKLSERDAKTLIAGGRIEKEFVWKKHDNQTSKKLLELDDNLRLSFVKTETSERVVKEFVVDGSTVIQTDFDKDGKHHRFFSYQGKDVYGVIACHLVTEEEFVSFARGETVFLTGLQGKKGSFDARTVLQEDGKFGFVFDQPQNEILYSSPNGRVESFNSKDGRPFYKVNGVLVPPNFRGHDFSLDELKTLSDKGELHLTDLWSAKKNKEYSATVFLQAGKLDMRFGD